LLSNLNTNHVTLAIVVILLKGPAKECWNNIEIDKPYKIWDELKTTMIDRLSPQTIKSRLFDN
jgi:hypothetical protein